MLRALQISLRNKVTLFVLGITVSALLLSAAGLVIFDLRSYERQTSADLSTQAQILARASAPAMAFNDPRTAEKDLSVMRVRRDVLGAALYTRAGELFASYRRSGDIATELPRNPGRTGYTIEGNQIVVVQPMIENGEIIGTIYLRGSYDPWERLWTYLTILFGVMIASLIVAAMLSNWLQGAVTAPIIEVAKVSGEVMRTRDFSLRATKLSEDEIGQLVDAFNAMLAELGRRSEELRLADQRKDEFLATLAHELRNPLAPIRTSLEILRLAGNDPEKARMAREIMQRQMNQMVRLVDDLLDLSRINTGKLAIRKAAFDLREAVRDAIETVSPFVEARQHKLDVRMPPEAIIVEGDRTRLAQVFANLVNNAAKYTEPGGHISLTLERDGPTASIHIRDDGIGISPEALETIFEMFVQVDRSLDRTQAGLGVGLTLARQLVELHGGRIEARSGGKGKGSEFVVQVPISTVAEDAATVPLPAQKNAAKTRRVLLADDNEDFAQSLGQLLSARGHEVRIARDGAEALEIAREFKPDIAFLDIGMPKVHGYEVARRLRAQPATAKCYLVAITGWGQEDDRNRAREAGFDKHLVKPVDPAEVEALVQAREPLQMA
jgi:signal transduction histidine kinase/ActR/RegA family two-component response regulator